ncbi:hypothetical protein NDU88_000087 [Pleurodeles waltl]|uniref:Uncharacterized protein n=1 Tax=Pleurodeles waltl TaxID=8319 RepID=A0AAV7VWJ3_PLEWA|nr:hypothetical protein NDU88_000087 [Pleurodeles waltl]
MTLSNQAFCCKPERPRQAAAEGVAAAVLTCSPPQQRVNKNTNARCLGEYKRKVKKETALILPITMSAVGPHDIAAKRSRAYVLATSEEKAVKERRASEEGKAELGGGSQLSVTAPPVETERKGSLRSLGCLAFCLNT